MVHHLAQSTQHYHNPETAAVIPPQVQKTEKTNYQTYLLCVGKSPFFTIQGSFFLIRVLELLFYEILASDLSTHVANPVMDLSHTGDSCFLPCTI